MSPKSKAATLPAPQTQEENVPQSPQDLQVLPDFQISLSAAKDRLAHLHQFVKEMMKEGVDYGLIPGCPKPSLFKSGAEKLCDIFGFSKQVDVISRMEDWEKGLFAYEVKATLTSKRTGLVEAEGIGSCNNKEKKYKNMDPYTLVNTILKMAKKRAIVDAVLSATRSSDLFTQDVEDMEELLSPTSEKTFGQPSKTSPEAMEAVPIKNVTGRQLHLIFKLVEEKGLSTNSAKEILSNKFGVSQSSDLTSAQASSLISYLQEM